MATKAATLSPPKLSRVPNRADIESTIRDIIIHVVTTTFGPRSVEVIIPCGGNVPPFPWNKSCDGKLTCDMEYQRVRKS